MALQERLGTIIRVSPALDRQKVANPIPMQIPIGFEANFKGLVDLLTMTAWVWEDDLGKDPNNIEIPADLKQQAEETRAKMVEKIAELDDELIMKFLEAQEISIDELKAALRKGVIANKAAPVFCGSSLKNKGVQILLDAVIDYVPSPADVPSIKASEPGNPENEFELPAQDDAPLSALVFKIVTDPYVGRLAYIRVYSGVLSQGQTVQNSTKGRKERIGRLIRMHADRREDITEIRSGDIGAAPFQRGGWYCYLCIGACEFGGNEQLEIAAALRRTAINLLATAGRNFDFRVVLGDFRRCRFRVVIASSKGGYRSSATSSGPKRVGTFGQLRRGRRHRQ